jgi:hypothetical protein
MLSKQKAHISITLLLVFSSLVLAACGGSEAEGLGGGRGMLYFYATW